MVLDSGRSQDFRNALGKADGGSEKVPEGLLSRNQPATVREEGHIDGGLTTGWTAILRVVTSVDPARDILTL